MSFHPVPGVRGGAMLYTNGDGYYFKIIASSRRTYGTAHYKCYRNLCNSRLFSKKGSNIPKKNKNFPDHNHESEPWLAAVFNLREKIRARVILEGHHPKKVFEEECAKVPIEVSSKLNYTKMESTLQKIHRKTLPRVPNSTEEFYETLTTRSRFNRTLDRKAFYRGKITVKGNRNFVFLSENFIKSIANSGELHVSTMPRLFPAFQGLQMVFVVMAVVHDYAFPVCFVLMGKATFESFKAIFKLMKKIVPNMQPSKFICGFESGIYEAIGEEFPQSEILHSWWNFSNCIVQKAVTSGLNNESSQCQARTIVQKCFSLPFLPPTLIKAGMNIIIEMASGMDVILYPILEYTNELIEDVGADQISVSNSPEQSRTDFEYLERDLTTSLTKSKNNPPNIWNFIERLQKIESTAHKLLCTMNRGEKCVWRKVEGRKMLLNDKVVSNAIKETLQDPSRTTVEEFLLTVSAHVSKYKSFPMNKPSCIQEVELGEEEEEDTEDEGEIQIIESACTDSQKDSGHDTATSGSKAQKAGTAGVGKGKSKVAPSSTLTSSGVVASQLSTPQASCSRDHDTQDHMFKHEEFIMEDYGDEDSMLETLDNSEGVFGDTGDISSEERANENDSNVVVCTPEFIKEEPPEEILFETVFCDEPPNIKQEVEEIIIEEADPSASNWDDPLEVLAMPTAEPAAVPIQSLGPQKRRRLPTARPCTCVNENAKRPRLAPKTFSGDVSIGPQPPPGPFDSFDASLHNAVIGFFVSLKRIPVEKRDPTKQKILELIDAIADHDLDPDWIKIMVVKPANTAVGKSKSIGPVKITPAPPKVNLPNIMLPQTNLPPSLPIQAIPKATPHLLQKPQTDTTEGLQPLVSSGIGLMTQPHTSMPISLPTQPQTMNPSIGLVTQQPTPLPINLPAQSQQTSTSLGILHQELTSVKINLPTPTPLPINILPQLQVNSSMNIVTQPITSTLVNLPIQSQTMNIESGLPIQMQTTMNAAVTQPKTISNTEIGISKQANSGTQAQTSAIDPPIHSPQSSANEMEMPQQLQDEGPS